MREDLVILLFTKSSLDHIKVLVPVLIICCAELLPFSFTMVELSYVPSNVALVAHHGLA